MPKTKLKDSKRCVKFKTLSQLNRRGKCSLVMCDLFCFQSTRSWFRLGLITHWCHDRRRSDGYVNRLPANDSLRTWCTFSFDGNSAAEFSREPLR